MASTVTVHMNTCSKTSKVTASIRDDGTIGVKIVSDCKNVQDYADKLTSVTMDDIVVFNGSKVVDPEVRASLSVPCLVPNAVFDAAWMEAGMLSKSLARRARENNVTFEKE